MLTIAQITDLHVWSDQDPPNHDLHEARLRLTLASIHALRPRPVAILATGDVTNTGSEQEFADLAAILGTSEIPVYLAMGNHDLRHRMVAHFPAPAVQLDADGFIQYAIDLDGLRILVCDTVDEGTEDGAFCDRRAAWLARTLDGAPGVPAALVLHHPPIASGIQWIDPDPNAPWIQRLRSVVTDRPQIVGIVCGHVHRAFHGVFAGKPVAVSAATAIELTLDMTDVDQGVADGREILRGEPPAFTLLMWSKGEFVVHNCIAGEFSPSIRYLQPFKRG